ncbi:hypothetical protein M409DRAFT_65873 [Zasmidium cellare ATCC 36951]|uniref:Major facilitator superfamily (MFS) profile domain-containing protein n=1 Tax=Zasmidium cellare ATCC 36951 TaxID=1080233 RepID=A0A6A6CL53_ZASCE|nr:uncharacterized protein M409DRAFT_65873 [Zasmidium cellare ATCC 36951]KAF2167771.1 hypothetical protein M409DRAFT_65873 [Zasmidium cellare ATCC 36951]
MPSPRIHDSFPRSFDEIDNESTTLNGAYQEFGMRRASLRPSTTQTIQTYRLSNLSSISEWSRQTIGCIQSSDFSWFRLEDENSRHSQSMRGGGDNEAPEEVVWGQTDEDNPINWKPWKKWVHVVMLSILSFVASMESLILAPAAPEVAKRLQIQSPLLLTIIVSIYVLGFATGPLLMAPLSELYGRLMIIHLSNWCFVGFTVACGFSQTQVQLLVLRFFAGGLGVACLSLGGAVVAEMFHPGHRAVAMAALEAGRLLGWFVGPIVGGIIVHLLDWRWVFWISAAAAGSNALIAIIALRETYAPILLQRRANQSPSEKRRLSMQGYVNSAISPSGLICHSILQPLKILCLNPLVAMTALYSGTLSGILILIATTIPFTYSRRYAFSALETGLVYIAPGVGMVMGLLVSGLLINCMSKRHKNISKAEDRISALGVLAGTVLAGGGLALYGWAARHDFHWIVPLIGLGVFGFGLLPLTTSVQSYLTEAYPSDEAGVMAANSIVRSSVSGLLPLSGLVIYRSLGVGWGNTLLAGILGVSILVPICCKIWGERLRHRFRVDT